MNTSIQMLNKINLVDACQLFDSYRQFYGQSADLDASSQFILSRFREKDSVVFIAYDADVAVGFSQLYPSYSSVLMKRIWILNDLYVVSDSRRKGVAKLLIDFAKKYAISSKAAKLVLATAHDNVSAQNLYRKNGFGDDNFLHYYLSLGKS